MRRIGVVAVVWLSRMLALVLIVSWVVGVMGERCVGKNKHFKIEIDFEDLLGLGSSIWGILGGVWWMGGREGGCKWFGVE